MKALEQHTLIYDNECPLCSAYTGGFIQCGLLDQNGRQSYTDASAQNSVTIDWNRARNEIALVDKRTNTVRYGIDSLTYLAGAAVPFLKPAFRWKPVDHVLRQLYFFISYNRRVIAPGKTFEATSACTPDLHTGYRWTYIVFAWLVTSVILVLYSRLLFPLIPQTDFLREFIICGGQLLFQGGLVMAINRKRVIHYLGNMMTVSLAGALMLCPAFLVTGISSNPWFYLGYFFVIVSLMLLEHIRRVSRLELPAYVSAGWVFYRLIVLLLILP